MKKKATPPKDDLEVIAPRLDGDITSEDWQDVLNGQTWEEYTQVIADKYAAHPHYDRNDMFRPHFNRMAPLGNRTASDVEAFYRSDIWCRLLAFECPKEGLLRSIINQYTSEASLAEAPLAGFLQAYDAHLKRHEDGETLRPFRVLDHGCGRGEFTLSALWLRPAISVVCCDFRTPARELLQRAIAKYMPWADVTFCWVGENDYETLGPYDYINSSEVLEHVWNPVEEAVRLCRSAKDGSTMHLSTFFNDCEGKNPSHLREHHKYQDTALWFGVLSQIGWEICGNDPRGIPKLFRKTTTT